MRVFIIDEDEKYTHYTKNIIYNKVFNEFLQHNYLWSISFFKTIKKKTINIFMQYLTFNNYHKFLKRVFLLKEFITRYKQTRAMHGN